MLITVDATDDVFWIQIGKRKVRTHSKKECIGDHCVIHNPSDHPLKGAPLNWRADRALMERICDHGIGHPDPDDIGFKRVWLGPDEAAVAAIHGCDGCC